MSNAAIPGYVTSYHETVGLPSFSCNVYPVYFTIVVQVRVRFVLGEGLSSRTRWPAFDSSSIRKAKKPSGIKPASSGNLFGVATLKPVVAIIYRLSRHYLILSSCADCIWARLIVTAVSDSPFAMSSSFPANFDSNLNLRFQNPFCDARTSWPILLTHARLSLRAIDCCSARPS